MPVLGRPAISCRELHDERLMMKWILEHRSRCMSSADRLASHGACMGCDGMTLLLRGYSTIDAPARCSGMHSHVRPHYLSSNPATTDRLPAGSCVGFIDLQRSHGGVLLLANLKPLTSRATTLVKKHLLLSSSGAGLLVPGL